MNPSRSRRQHLLPKREGTAKNSRRFASGKHGGVERSFFLYSEDLYLASQRNDRGTTLRFGRHRRPFMQMQLPSASLLLADLFSRVFLYALLLLFCGVSRVYNVTVSKSHVMDKGSTT